MTQPVPRYTQDDLERVLARDFPPQSLAEAKMLLARNFSGPGELRVWMACLKCADGSIDGLRRALDTVCRDFRDILVAAEYPHYMDACTAEERAGAIERDWQQLQDWLHRAS